VRLAKFFDKVDGGGEEILLAGLGFTAKRRSPQHDTLTISQGHKIWGEERSSIDPDANRFALDRGSEQNTSQSFGLREGEGC
jgi:hypothetical protein